jgi:hypothetical protein
MLLIVLHGVAFALECASPPVQLTKDVQVEVNAAVAKIGPVSGGELKNQTRIVTQDLLSKLPDANKVYLEQMMFSAYCSALRDDKAQPEARKAQLLLEYSTEVRRVLYPQSKPPKSPQPSPQHAQPSAPAPQTIGPRTARFGVTLGWELARYEFAKDSPFEEVKAAEIQIEEDIKALLLQDGYPRSLEGQSASQVIRNILLYYGATNLQKHATILVGIAALRTSLIGSSQNQELNEEMKKLAFSAIQEIDNSVILRKQEFFEKLEARRPKNVPETSSLLVEVLSASPGGQLAATRHYGVKVSH